MCLSCPDCRAGLPVTGSSPVLLSRPECPAGSGCRTLSAVTDASGVAVIYIDPRFTSQQCHVCGHTARGNRDSQAMFRCQQCGHSDHADVNAARNILARGLATMAVPAPAPGHGAHARISRQHPLARREPARYAA
jgi:ribosomal protein L37AE/L43A